MLTRSYSHSVHVKCHIKGMMYHKCTSACPNRCGRAARQTCNKLCVNRCACPTGLFIDHTKKACVQESACTAKQPTTHNGGCKSFMASHTVCKGSRSSTDRKNQNCNKRISSTSAGSCVCANGNHINFACGHHQQSCKAACRRAAHNKGGKVKKIPNGCLSWFDGCNTCTVVKGKRGVCGTNTCSRRGGQKCLKYSSCRNNKMCGDSHWCRRSAKRGNKKTCVVFAKPDGKCGGYVPTYQQQRCDHKHYCRHPKKKTKSNPLMIGVCVARTKRTQIKFGAARTYPNPTMCYSSGGVKQYLLRKTATTNKGKKGLSISQCRKQCSTKACVGISYGVQRQAKRQLNGSYKRTTEYICLTCKSGAKLTGGAQARGFVYYPVVGARQPAPPPCRGTDRNVRIPQPRSTGPCPTGATAKYVAKSTRNPKGTCVCYNSKSRTYRRCRRTAKRGRRLQRGRGKYGRTAYKTMQCKAAKKYCKASRTVTRQQAGAMARYCKATCGFCKVRKHTGGTVTSCVDKSRVCSRFKSYCGRTKQVASMCPVTCGKCVKNVNVYLINAKHQCGQASFPPAWTKSALAYAAKHNLKLKVGTCKSKGYGHYVGHKTLANTGAPGKKKGSKAKVVVRLYVKGKSTGSSGSGSATQHERRMATTIRCTPSKRVQGKKRTYYCGAIKSTCVGSRVSLASKIPAGQLTYNVFVRIDPSTRKYTGNSAALLKWLKTNFPTHAKNVTPKGGRGNRLQISMDSVAVGALARSRTAKKYIVGLQCPTKKHGGKKHHHTMKHHKGR